MPAAEPNAQSAAQYTRGALYGLAAVSIWSGWIVVARPRLTHEPHALGYRGPSLRRGRPAPAAVRAEQRTCAIDRLGWVGLAAIVLGGGAPVLLANRPAVRAGGTCRRPVSRRHAADGRDSGGGYSEGGIHSSEMARLRADPARRLRHRLGTGGSTGSQQTYRSRAVSRIGLGLGLLHGRHAPARASMDCMPLPSLLSERWCSTCRHIGFVAGGEV